MGKGKVWPPEWTFTKDRTTGVNICQLTNYMGHSYHLYFTEKGWYNEGRNLVFRSDRNNSSNLFSIDLETGRILQLTDLGKGPSYLSACLNPQGSELYYHHNHALTALNLETLEQRTLFEKPDGFNIGNFNCTADGSYLLLALGEDISSKVDADLKNGYVGFEEVMRARPLSRILRISLQSGEVETVFEDECFIGHINASPTDSNVLTFCHEGPWNIVDHRIWGLDLDTGRKWKIRGRIEPMEMVGHEYWLEGGEYVGYHGMRESGVNFFGRIRPDNTDMEEVEFPFTTWHSYSSDFSRVVVDSRDTITSMCLWQRQDGRFTQPRVLLDHRCSFHVQKVHAHPLFTPDGSKLLYTSDKNGYGNLYLADIPDDITQLPELVLPDNYRYPKIV